MNVISVKMDIGELKRIGGEVGKGGESLWVRLSSEEQKSGIWANKDKLRGRRERILEDWTWKERRMRWKLEEIARVEEGQRRKVWVGYGKIKIDEVWWKWDKEKEVLRNWRGITRTEEREEEEREKDRGLK